MRRGAAFRWASVVAAAGAVALTGCGDDGTPANRGTTGPARGVVNLYASLHGGTPGQRRSMDEAIRLALGEQDSQAGRFTVRYRRLDRASSRSLPAEVAAGARQAARDPQAVGYIGELSDASSAISIPILNAAGMAQVSPMATAVGLTTGEPGAGTDEPDRHYPSGTRTFARVIPRDAVEAGALVTRMAEDGCSRVAIAGSTARSGAALRAAMTERDAGSAGLRLLAPRALSPGPIDAAAMARAFREEGVGCFVYTGAPSAVAARVYRAVANALPGASLYGTHRTCVPAFTGSGPRSLPSAAADLFLCTRPVLPVRRYPGGADFAAAYRRAYDREPDPYAIYGYEATRLLLRAVTAAGRRGDDRGAVVAALRALNKNPSTLGRYSLDQNGDTSLATFGVYRVDGSGTLRFDDQVVAAAR